MKKYFALISVLALSACGGGSGGGFQSSDSVTAIEIPQQRVSTTVKENKNITSMSHSVNNIGEMTIEVEKAVGSDLLAEMSKDLDGVASSIRNYSNREISGRRNSAVPSLQTISANTKAQTAYAFLEYARRFRGLSKNNQIKFMNEHPDQRNFVMGWGKLFCDCDVSNLSDSQLLNLFQDATNQQRFDDFYNKNHYKEILLDNVSFNVVGFNNGEPDDSEMQFIVNNKSGVITGFKIVDTDGETVATMNRNTDSKGNYIDTFKDIGWKYQIVVSDTVTYTTDTFSNKVSGDELLEAITDSLEGYDEDYKDSVLQAFNDHGGNWVEQISADSFDLKGKQLGLSYSDFGYTAMVTQKFGGNEIPVEEQKTDNSVVIGGFKAKEIDTEKFADETLTFTGKAIGAAAYYLGNTGESKQIETGTNGATLTFNNGTENLTMEFDDYYTVNVVKTGDNATVSFSGYPSTADPNFRFSKETGISTENENDLVNVQIKYYGDNYVPSEVVGGVAYEEHAENSLKSFESAFGMTKGQQ